MNEWMHEWVQEEDAEELGRDDNGFDVVVIGAGLVGSAAAKYLLKLDPSLKVALVGPEEGQRLEQRRDTSNNTATANTSNANADDLEDWNDLLDEELDDEADHLTNCGGGGGWGSRWWGSSSNNNGDDDNAKNRKMDDGSALGCWHDEGRITRRLDGDPVWALLAGRSIARYADIERESRIRFHFPVGSVTQSLI